MERNLPAVKNSSEELLAKEITAKRAMSFYEGEARSKNTNRAYLSDWFDFEKWCVMMGRRSLPANPETVALYLSYRAPDLKASTLSRRLIAIRQAHILYDLPFDHRHRKISETWKGIRNVHGVKQSYKSPINISDLRELINLLPHKLIGTRDRAILLIGFAGAFRRSEIVGLNVEDVSFEREGLIVRLIKSKTDQEQKGREVGIPYGSNFSTCPVRALEDWISSSGITSGALFRGINKREQISSARLSDKAVALIVKRAISLRAKEKKLSPEDELKEVEKFSGHSLRAGFATTASSAGVPEHSIMVQTGHRRTETLRRYVRKGTIFIDNPASKIGL